MSTIVGRSSKDSMSRPEIYILVPGTKKKEMLCVNHCEASTASFDTRKCFFSRKQNAYLLPSYFGLLDLMSNFPFKSHDSQVHVKESDWKCEIHVVFKFQAYTSKDFFVKNLIQGHSQCFKRHNEILLETPGAKFELSSSRLEKRYRKSCQQTGISFSFSRQLKRPHDLLIENYVFHAQQHGSETKIKWTQTSNVCLRQHFSRNGFSAK